MEAILLRRTRLKLAGIAAAGLMLGFAAIPASAGNVGARVDVNNFNYSPAKVKIQKGKKVVWTNREGTHTVTINKLGYDKVISGSESVSRRFRKAGRYPYYCRFHTAQGQFGKVIVRR